MESQLHGLVLGVSISLLALTLGEPYSVAVSPTEETRDGVCYKEVTVSGGGVSDKVPATCDTVEYVVANEKNLVVGETVFSDKSGTMTVVGPEGWEQRIYVDSTLQTTEPLVDADCDMMEEMLMVNMAALPGNDLDWNVKFDPPYHGERGVTSSEVWDTLFSD